MSGQRLSIGLQAGSASAGLALAAAAERQGVEAIWIGSPFSPPHPEGDTYRVMTAAAVAARTGGIRIGCVLTLVDPDSTLRLAEDLAMVDQAAGGRLELLFELGHDPAREARAAELLAAWRGWRTADGRSFPVTPRPAQPQLPRLVVDSRYASAVAQRLAAGVLGPARALEGRPAEARTSAGRRAVAFPLDSVEVLVAGRAAEAAATLRAPGLPAEADEVAIWIAAGEPRVIEREVELAARVLAPAVAGGETTWEMLAELGARSAGVGAPS